MAAGARGRSARVELVTYPGAHHAFDHPNLPLQERTGLAFTADGSGRAHVGTDANARQDSIRRVTEWLAR
jgi:dienelactone hydrolase